LIDADPLAQSAFVFEFDHVVELGFERDGFDWRTAERNADRDGYFLRNFQKLSDVGVWRAG
jgi:hypothetical protein